MGPDFIIYFYKSREGLIGFASFPSALAVHFKDMLPTSFQRTMVPLVDLYQMYSHNYIHTLPAIL